MKGLKTILGIALATTGVGGAAAVGAVTFNQTNQSAIVVQAESLPNKIYFKLSGTHWADNWHASASNIKAYMWNDSSNNGWGTGTTGTAVTVGDEAYASFDVGSYTKVLFIAFNDWSDGKPQNRTNDYDIPTNGNDLFSMTTYNENTYKQDGDWSKMFVESGSKVYFVDGYSWHSLTKAYIWGTGNNGSYPGAACSDSGLRLKAYVGETEYSGLHIYEYTTTIDARYIIFSKNGDDSNKTGNLLLQPNGVYFFGVNDMYEPVVEALLSLKSHMGAATYNSLNFSNSVCALSQSEAQAFVDEYDTLAANDNQRIKDSIAGSGLVTYSDPENSTSTTAEVSLADVRTALVNKYPTLANSAKINVADNDTKRIAGVMTIVVLLSASTIAFILLKKKRTA